MRFSRRSHAKIESDHGLTDLHSIKPKVILVYVTKGYAQADGKIRPDLELDYLNGGHRVRLRELHLVAHGSRTLFTHRPVVTDHTKWRVVAEDLTTGRLVEVTAEGPELRFFPREYRRRLSQSNSSSIALFGAA